MPKTFADHPDDYYESWEVPMSGAEIEAAKAAFTAFHDDIDSGWTLATCTCTNCPRHLTNTCSLQFDGYNTDGDCLLSK